MRAAQYVRMSTEHQRYSITNQQTVIGEYAKAHGFDIVCTYADEGKSGLDLVHRPGLRRLLDDVMSGAERFGAVLVYDVSRWGRFQDTDESAHYEFLCKQSGVRVHYCAEPFSNDDSLLSSLCKALKRSMAGEFSRELGVKVFAGQRRLTELGYKMGGTPGFGLKRILLSVDGDPQIELRRGERKCLSTQHVVYAPVSERETAVVRRIFRLYLDENMGLKEIAEILNAEGVPKHNGWAWAPQNIRKILVDPKYAGCAVFGRSTKKLRSRTKAIPQQQWIVRPNSFEPMVPLELIKRAQSKLSSRYRSDTELLDSIRAYVERNGAISKRLMRPSNNLPDQQTISVRFGSVVNAYKLAGIELSQSCIWGQKAALAISLRNAAVNEFRDALAATQHPFHCDNRLYRVEGLQPFRLATAKRISCRGGRFFWRLCSKRGMEHQHCVVVRMKPDYTGVQDWCLVKYVPTRKGRRSFADEELQATETLRHSAAEVVSILLERLRIP